jgi:hypothetical protein
MKHTLKSLLALMASLLLLMAFGMVQAQDATEEATEEPAAETTSTAPQIGYYIAEVDGVDQVYQQILGGQNQPRQITFAESDVITFGAAYDGLGIAYIIDGQLWIQSVHVEEAEAIATLETEGFFKSPVFSQDGNYIAYADHGVWLLDLATRETTQILEDIDVAEDGSNIPEARSFAPKHFVVDADGNITHLVLDVSVWEWDTDAVYNLETGELQIIGDDEPTQQFHTDLLPLSDGRVLLYGNMGVGGEGNLHIADSIEDINTYEEVLNFGSLTEDVLFAMKALEIEPGTVRIFGTALALDAPVSGLTVFWFDFNINDSAASDVTISTVTEGSETGSDFATELSPDGSLVTVYENAQYSELGPIYGQLHLVDLTTGEPTADTFPETVGVFHFQPLMPAQLMQ